LSSEFYIPGVAALVDGAGRRGLVGLALEPVGLALEPARLARVDVVVGTGVGGGAADEITGAGAGVHYETSWVCSSRSENEGFQSRWETIQTGFVDEPRQTVEQADELVAEVMKRLAEGFATERERLEGQWGRGEDVSTEDLRIALQRYRGFFQRLLSA